MCPGVCASCAAAPSGLPSVAASTRPERLHQRHARVRRFWRIASECLRVGERGGLRGRDGRIGHRAGLVLVQRGAHGLVGRLHGLILHRVLRLQNAQRRELILDLLEGTENGLAVVGDRGVVGRARRDCTCAERRPKSNKVAVALPPKDHRVRRLEQSVDGLAGVSRC